MKKDEFILALKQTLIMHNTSDIEEIISDFEDHFAAAKQEGKTEEEIAEMLGQPELIAEQYPTALTAASQPPLSDLPASEHLSDSSSSQLFTSDTPVTGQPSVSVEQSNVAKAKTENSKAEHNNTGQSKADHNNAGHFETQKQSADKAKSAGSTSVGSNYSADNLPKYVRAEDNTNTAAPAVAVPPAQPAGYPQAGHQNTQAEIPSKIDSGKVIALVFINLFIMIPLVFTIFGILIGFWSASIGVGVGGAALFAVAVLQQGVQVQILILFGISLTALCLLLFITSYYLTKASILGLIRYIRWNGTWVKEK